MRSAASSQSPPPASSSSSLSLAGSIVVVVCFVVVVGVVWWSPARVVHTCGKRSQCALTVFAGFLAHRSRALAVFYRSGRPSCCRCCCCVRPFERRDVDGWFGSGFRDVGRGVVRGECGCGVSGQLGGRTNWTAQRHDGVLACVLCIHMYQRSAYVLVR